MKKARLSILITMFTVFVMLFAASCTPIDSSSGNSTPSEVELIFEVPETEEIPYYEYYTVPEITVIDTDGNVYIPKVTVSNANGKTVDFEEGKFFVIYTEDYYIEYEVLFNGENVSKIITCKVADKTKPELTLSVDAIGAFVGEVVTLPECSYEDNMTAVEELSLTVKVMFGDTEVAITDGVFTATEAGVYKANYAVTDKNGNVTEKIVDIAVVAREPGNIAYFNHEYAQMLCGLKPELAATFIERGTGVLASPMGGSSTAISYQNSTSPWGGRLDITAPAVTDISSYNYLYLWVYTPYSSGLKLTYNNVWAGVQTNISPNVWTRILFTKGEDGNFYAVGTDNSDASATTRLFGSATDSANITSMADSSHSLFILAAPLNSNGGDVVDVYFGGFCATNELPELPEGTKEWMPAPKMFVSNITGSAEQGETVDPIVDVQFAEGSIVKTYVSINGADREEVAELPFTYENVGTYVFTFEALLNGEVILTQSFEVTVTESNANMKVIARLASDAAINAYGLKGGWSAETTMAVTPEIAGITYPVNGELPIRFNAVEMGGIMITAPALTDITGYQYLFVDVMIGYGDAEFFIYAYGAPIITVKGGNTWTRLVYVNDGKGNFVLPGATGNLSAADGHDGTHVAFTDPANNESFYMMVKAPDNWAYFGQFTACQELPELPAGFETNYTGEEEQEPEDEGTKVIAKLTSDAAINAYGLKGGWSAETTMAVTPEIAGITYPVNGELPIRFNAVELGGIMVNAPAVTNLTAYQYLFVDVMIAYGDAEFFIYAYGAPIITVKGGNTWTRVVYVNDGNGNFVLPGATGNLSAADGHDGTHVAFESPANISSVNLMVRAIDNWAYFGQFTACQELPELPAGFETNYFEIVDFTDAKAIETYNLNGNFGANIVYDENAHCVRMDSNPDGVYTGMVVKNPTITDISNFKYIYLDVKVGWGDANIVFNFAWGAPYFTLTGSQGGDIWIRVIAENDGTGKFTLINASGNMSDGQPIDASIFGTDGVMTSANIAGLGIHILSGGNNVYFKHLVACDQLPTIPQGMVSNYIA